MLITCHGPLPARKSSQTRQSQSDEQDRFGMDHAHSRACPDRDRELLIEPAPNRWNARATTIPIATSGRRMWPAPISKRSMRSRRCVALAIVRPKQLPGAPTAVAPCCVDGLGRLRDRSRAFESKSPPLGWGRQTGEGLAEQNRSVPRHGRPRGTSHELPLLLVPVQGGKGVHPRHRRAEPVLPAWDEVTALAQDSHPYHVGRLLPSPGEVE